MELAIVVGVFLLIGLIVAANSVGMSGDEAARILSWVVGVPVLFIVGIVFLGFWAATIIGLIAAGAFVSYRTWKHEAGERQRSVETRKAKGTTDVTIFDATYREIETGTRDKEEATAVRAMNARYGKGQRLATASARERDEWRTTSFEAGSFSVVLSGFRTGAEYEVARVAEFLSDIPVLRDQSAQEIRDLAERVVHVSPQTIAERVAQGDAIRLKVALENRGGKVKIVEIPNVQPPAGGRATIPVQVRREVWRRDEGRCVDCGSRERLEFDHTIPVSKGGANTARNIELRCESCNRRKAASI